jgi:hypothetical protein
MLLQTASKNTEPLIFIEFLRKAVKSTIMKNSPIATTISQKQLNGLS